MLGPPPPPPLFVFVLFPMTPLPSSTEILFEWPVEAYHATIVRQNFVTTKFWQIFVLRHPPPPTSPFHPIVMRRGEETMFNKITFIFSKE